MVSRGRKFWQAVGREPAAFQDHLDEAAFVRPDYVVSSVFNERFGEEMVLVLYHPELAEKYRTTPKQQECRAEPAAAPDRGVNKASRGSRSPRRRGR